MPVITYCITLLEPAIFAALEGEPNSAVSYDFVPGSAVRGMLIGAYRRQQGALDASDPTVRNLFFSDATRFLNAYVVDAATQTRMLPTPASWQHPKYTTRSNKEPIDIQDSVFTPGASSQSSEATDSNGDEHVKMENTRGFVHMTGQKQANWVKNVPRVLNVHTQRPRRGGGEGQLYRYDALAAHLIFEGVILCDDAHAAQTIHHLLNGIDTVTIGGARSAGYGRAKIDQVREAEGWMEASFLNDQSAQVVLTLVSDAIVRDKTGNYQPTWDALSNALIAAGMDLSNAIVEQAMLSTAMVGGFNRKWGLPLPQTPAIKRGSVIILKSAPSADLDRLVWEGIGERRNEGFGRIAVNWQHADQLTASKVEPAIMVSEPVALSKTSQVLWDHMQKRLDDAMLQDAGGSVAYSRRYTISGSITRTQIARLRAKIADELRKSEPQRSILTRFLTDVQGKAAGNQFERARIGKASLANWLRDPQFGLAADMHNNDYVVLRLVDAVLERAQKSRSGQDA